MAMITPVGFQTTLTDKLLIGQTDLPIPASDAAMLSGLLSDTGHVFLTVQDQVGTEVIKVSGACGSFTVARGQDGTAPLNFPKGSCVAFRVTPAVVRDMVCNTTCCEGDCCTDVAVAGSTLADGTVGAAYKATVIFSGTLPIQIAVSGVPVWMTAQVGPNYVNFTGVPPVAQDVTIGAAATNCGGAVVSVSDTIVIS